MGGGFVLYLTDFLRHLSKTHALNCKNLLDSIIARRVSKANATKQSTKLHTTHKGIQMIV
ncbi:hypothetical protein ACWIUD_06685 [Helicobacter sp. 23-1044]